MLPNQQNGMDPQDQRNFIIAMALMIVFVFGYQFFVLDPAAERANEQREAAQALQESVAETPVAELEGVTAAPETPATDSPMCFHSTAAWRLFSSTRTDPSKRVR